MPTKSIAHLQKFIDRFKAKATKAKQAQSRVKALEKIEKIELPKKRQVVSFDFRAPPRSGEQVAVLEGVNDHENLGSIFRNAAGLGVDVGPVQGRGLGDAQALVGGEGDGAPAAAIAVPAPAKPADAKAPKQSETKSA